MTDANITPKPLQLENRIKWVALLRSDKYTQTTGRLARASGNARCCLGVACDASITPGLKIAVDIEGDRIHFGGSSAMLPDAAMDALGLVRDDVLIPMSDPALSGWTDEGLNVSTLNDTHGFTFAQIADVIERNFITPFLGAK